MGSSNFKTPPDEGRHQLLGISPVKNALRMGAIGFDAVKHLVLCQIEKRPPKLDLDVYPYLPKANVGTTSAASYMSLMRGRAA
jgi:hypothetical protein